MWPDNFSTFPQLPKATCPPQWEPHRDPTLDADRFRFQRKRLASYLALAAKTDNHDPPGLVRDCLEDGNTQCNQVRRDPASFYYIVKRRLYLYEGLAQAFADSSKRKHLKFPRESLELKAEWEYVPKEPPPANRPYHWNRDKEGHMYKLIGLHIMTRALPNWTWATWELADNPRRCIDNGCRDRFGNRHPIIHPEDCKSGKCPDGDQYWMTKRLARVFSRYDVSKEWQNYRLNDAQTDFEKPERLGNSTIEVNNVKVSSCIACHNVARVGNSGHLLPEYFDFSASSSDTPIYGKPTPAQTHGAPISFVWSAVLNAIREEDCQYSSSLQNGSPLPTP
jgi:hypothetical protein